MEARISKIFFLSIFFCLLFLPILLKVSEINEVKKSTENRKLNELPVFDIKHLDPFPSKFEAFYNDNFPFRNTLLEKLSLFNAKYFLKSPLPDKVVLGSDDWMYAMNSDFNFFIGKEYFTPAQSDSIINELARRQDTCNKFGVDYRIVVIPSKARIYPEYLPANFIKSNSDAVKNLLTLLQARTKIKILYLEDSLVKYKNRTRIFKKLDSHWSDAGTFLGYSFIVNWLKTDYSFISRIDEKKFLIADSTIKSGNICNQIALDDYYSEEVKVYKQKADLGWKERKKENYPVWNWFGYPWEYERAYKNSDTTLPGLMIIRDSFTNDLLQHLLASHFGRSTFIWDYWQHKLNYNIMKIEKPKLVIDIINENFLKNYIIYPEKYLSKIDPSGK